MSITKRKKAVSHQLVELGLSKTEIGRRVGATPNYIINALNGRVIPSERLGEAIANELQMSASEIWPELGQ